MLGEDPFNGTIDSGPQQLDGLNDSFGETSFVGRLEDGVEVAWYVRELDDQRPGQILPAEWTMWS